MRGYGTLENVQSWWEVPCIAHFCSLFRLYFELLDFDIEELEEALITDGVEDSAGNSHLLQDLIVRLLRGCFNGQKNEITSSNYQMYLRRLFRIKCEEDPTKNNPFDGDLAFHYLPLRKKVEILRDLCDFRLDSDDASESLKALEAESLRVVPLGQDSGGSTYWYFYGTRLYREDYSTTSNDSQPVKKRGRKGNKQNSQRQQQIVTKWQVACFTEQDWQILAAKFKNCKSPHERGLHRTLRDDFLPELPRLFAEKEKLQRKRMLEQQLRRNGRSLDDEPGLNARVNVNSASCSSSAFAITNGLLQNGGKPSRIRNSSTLSLLPNPNLLNNLNLTNNKKSRKGGESSESESEKKARWGCDDDNSWSSSREEEEEEDEDDDNNNNNKISAMDLDDEHSGRECSPPDEDELRRRREEQEKADRLFAEAIEREERKARLHLRERRGGGTFSSPSNAGSRNSSSVSTERTHSIKASTVSKQTIAAAVSKKSSKASPVKASPVKNKKSKKGSSNKAKSGKGRQNKKGGGGRQTNNSLSVSLTSLADEDEESSSLIDEKDEGDDEEEEEEEYDDGRPLCGYPDDDDKAFENHRELYDPLSPSHKREDDDDNSSEKNYVGIQKGVNQRKAKIVDIRSVFTPSPSPEDPLPPPPRKKTKKSQKGSPKKKVVKRDSHHNDDDDDDDVDRDFQDDSFKRTREEDVEDEFCEEEEEADYESVERTLHNNNNHKANSTKGKSTKEKGGSSKTKGKSKEKKGKKEMEGMTEKGKNKEKGSKKSKKTEKLLTSGKGGSKKSSKSTKSIESSTASTTGLIGSSTINLGSGTSKTKVKSSVLFSQSEEDVQIGMHKVIEAIKNHREAWPFINPVDEDYAPNYYRIIDHPMDLQTMEDKLDNQEYSSLDEFKGDFDRIVDNCRKYNGPVSEYTEMVETVEEAFNKLIQRYIIPDESDEEISIEYTNATSNSDRKRSVNHHSPASSPSKKKTKESSKSSSSIGHTSKEHKKENEPTKPKKKSKSSSDSVRSTSPSKSTTSTVKEMKEKEKLERKKKKAQLMRHHSRDSVETSATAETLKDINKWLDDTPKPVENYTALSIPTVETKPKISKGDVKDFGSSAIAPVIKQKKAKKLLSSSGSGQKRSLAELSSKKARSTQFIMDEDDEYNIDRDLSPPPAKISKSDDDKPTKTTKTSKKGKGIGGLDGGKEKKEVKGNKKDKHHHHHKKHHHHHHHHHKRDSTSADDSATPTKPNLSAIKSSKIKSKLEGPGTKKPGSPSSSSISSMSTATSTSQSQQQSNVKKLTKGKGTKRKPETDLMKKVKGGKKAALAGSVSGSANLLNSLKGTPVFKKINQASKSGKSSSSTSSETSLKGATSSGKVELSQGGTNSNTGGTLQGPGSAFDALLNNLNAGTSGGGGIDGASSSVTAEKKKCLLVSDLPADKEGKLSLGSVLSTDAIKLGNFNENEDDLSDEEEQLNSKVKTEEAKKEDKEEKDSNNSGSTGTKEIQQEESEEVKDEDYEVNRKLEPSKGFNREKCMPNLSAWIKAFGGPVKTGSSGIAATSSPASSVSTSTPLSSPVKKPDPDSKNKFRVMGRGVGEPEGRSHHHMQHQKPLSNLPATGQPPHHQSVIKTTPLPSPSAISGRHEPTNVGPSWNPVSLPRPSPPSNPLLNPTKQTSLERSSGSSAGNKVEDLSSPPSSHSHHHSSKKHRNRKMSSSSLSSQSESGSPICGTPGHEGSSSGSNFISGSVGGSVVNPPRWVDDQPWGLSQSQSPSASSHVSSQSPAGPNSPFSPSVNSPPPSTPQTPPRVAPVRVGFYQDITASQHSSPDKLNESQSSPATPPTPSSLHGGGNGNGTTAANASGSISSSRRSIRGESGPLYAPRYIANTPSPSVNVGPGSNQSLPSPSTPPSGGGMNESLSNPNSPHSPKVVNMSSAASANSSSSSSGAADYRSHSNSGSGSNSSNINGSQGPAHQHSSRPSSTSVLHTSSPYSTPPAHHFSSSMEQHLRNASGASHHPDPAHSHSHHHHHSSSTSNSHHQTPAHAHSNASHVHSLSHLGQPQQAHAGSNQYHDSGSGRYPPNLPHAHQQSSVATTPPSTSSSYSGGSSGTSSGQNLSQAHAHSRQSTSQAHLSHPYPSNPYASNPRSINVAPNVYNNPISSDPSMNRYYKAAMAAVASASGNSSGGSELTLTMGPSSGGSSQSSSSTTGSSSKRHSRSNASANAPSPHEIPRSASVNPTAAAAVAAALEAGKIAPGDLANGFHWPHNLASLTQIVNSIPSAYRHLAAAAQQEAGGYPVTSSAGGVPPSSTPTPGSGKSHHHHQSEKNDPIPAHHHHHHHHSESSHVSGGSSTSSSSKKQSKSASASEAKSRSQSASAKSSSSASTGSSGTSGGGIVPGSAFNFSSLNPESLALYSKEMSDASSLYSASPPTLTPPMAHRASEFYPTASSASHFPHHSSFSAARTTAGGVPTPPITPYPFLPGSHPSPYQAHQSVSSQPFAAHSQSSRGLDPYQQLFQGSPHVMGLLPHPSGYPAPYAHPHSSLGFNRPGWI